MKCYPKSIFFVLLVILIVSISGCNLNSVPKNTSFEKKPKDISKINYLDHSKEDGTISYGIIDENGIVETDGIYHINYGEKFERFLTIKNRLGNNMQFTIFTINNYQQKEFVVDDQSFLKKDVYIENNTDIQVPFELDNLNKGYNDIICFIAVDTGHIESKDEKELHPNLVEIRFTVYYGDKTVPSYDVLSPLAQAKECLITIASDISKTEMSLDNYAVEKNKKNELYIGAGNNLQNEGNFAIILFEDWVQKDIEESSFVLATIPGIKSITLPFNVTYAQDGNHQITAVIINNIYETYDMDNSIVNISPRLDLEVK